MEVYIDLTIDLSRLLECHVPCVEQECTRLMKLCCGMCNVGSLNNIDLSIKQVG
jgi:hypothetical protein